MFRKLSLLFVSALIGLLLFGCGQSAAPTDDPATTASGGETPAADGEAVEVTWWQITSNDAQLAALNEIIAGFEAANPGITIKLEQRAIDPHKEALRVAMGTAAFPDIYFMWAGLGLGGEFVNAGASADLSEYYEQYGWGERLVPPALAAAQQYGGHHGVPEVSHPQGIYYRKDLFEAAGITAEPTTYEELIAANDALVASGVAPIQFGGTVNWHLMRLLDNLLETTCGIETHDALKALEANWGSEACVAEAFQALKTWSDDYIVDGFIGIDNAEATQLMYAGLAASALEGDWMTGVFPAEGQDPENYGLFAFPTGSGRLYAFTQMNYVGANSPHMDEAAAFLDYLSSPEIQERYLGIFGSTSVTQGVALPETATSLDHEWVDVLAAGEGVFENGDQALPLEITTEYWRIMNAVAIGEIAPADAGTALQTFIESR